MARVRFLLDNLCLPFLLVEVVVGIFQELVEDEPVAYVASGQDEFQAAPHVLVVPVRNLRTTGH